MSGFCSWSFKQFAYIKKVSLRTESEAKWKIPGNWIILTIILTLGKGNRIIFSVS